MWVFFKYVLYALISWGVSTLFEFNAAIQFSPCVVFCCQKSTTGSVPLPFPLLSFLKLFSFIRSSSEDELFDDEKEEEKLEEEADDELEEIEKDRILGEKIY